MILGKNLILTIGDENRGLAANKSCQLSTDTEFIDVCSPVEGDWKEVIPTINSWSTSADTLVASLADHTTLLKKQVNKEKLVCCFFDSDLQAFYKGYCYISGLQIKATVGSLASMSVNIKPTGRLEWAEEVNIKTATGTKLEGYTLSYTNSSVRISTTATGSVFIKEVALTADTRITLDKIGAVIKADAATVSSWISSNNATSLNSNLVLSSSGSVLIKGTNTVCFVANAKSTNTDIYAKTLSKF